MVRGRNTRTISVRLPDDTATRIQHYADKRGISISDWLKPIIQRALTPGQKEIKNGTKQLP